ncbi:type I-E CRISPR-associated protein Cse1/CasA [Aerococcaceae bacterium DSM 111020]|nr:type I-E CRISPR-associated protein Cse1/CasA [Aerococcaceae bacterium DSM 111020]
MGRFNLIDEPWISVILNDVGETKLVSIKTLFKDATNFRQLGGDMRMQDFAVLRILLAILHTVYSRYSADDELYSYLEINEKGIPVNDISDWADEYIEDLLETWTNLWEQKYFSDCVFDYLDEWYDHFYLYDDERPFMQITEKDLSKFEINKKAPGTVSGKMINRTLSESNNKLALFASKSNKEKEILTDDEIVRWLMLFQGCIGTFDKTNFGKEKYRSSKGWLYDIGGIALKGKNLFETLMLNLILVHPEEQYQANHQTPTWEFNGTENIQKHMSEMPLTNLAELYSIWGRAIIIDPEHDASEPFEMKIIKLKDINHQNQFLEPMTLWRKNDSGDNKGTLTPRKHNINHEFWQSFGLVFPVDNNTENNRNPGIIDWLYDYVEEEAEEIEMISFEAMSMIDDGNATSWMPSDEYYDSLKLYNYLAFDYTDETGWIDRINNEVTITKELVHQNLRRFYRNIAEIRNIKNTEQIDKLIQEVFHEIDWNFKKWLANIHENSEKDVEILKWRKQLENILIHQADLVMANASPRDYKGIKKENGLMTIVTEYNSFIYWMRRKLKG